MLSCSFQISVGKPSESLRRLVRSRRSVTIVGSGEAVSVSTEMGVGVLVRVAVGDKDADGVGESLPGVKVALAGAACAFLATMDGMSVHPSTREPIITKPAETYRIRRWSPHLQPPQHSRGLLERHQRCIICTKAARIVQRFNDEPLPYLPKIEPDTL